jgi:hypothetical protein
VPAEARATATIVDHIDDRAADDDLRIAREFL